MIKRIFLWGLIILLVIQLVPVNRENPKVIPVQDFINAEKPNEKVADLLKRACYDCHSNETKYPAYAYVAPVSWVVKDHINEGREHGNFSIWTTYNTDIQTKFLSEAIEEIEKGKMPMKSYILWHSEAQLKASEKDELIQFFKDLREKVKLRTLKTE